MSFENDLLGRSVGNALRIMRDAGFELSDKLAVSVDPKLPFMGYSTRKDSEDIIVISGEVLKSGMIEELLVHEMSHIYRITTNHPSHNSKLLNKVGYSVMRKRHLTKGYQIKLIQQAVNHVQDLYADDISFKVFSHSNLFPPNQASAFFLNWINDQPSRAKGAKTVWLNIGTMLDNCFALSNMIRHNVPDPNHEAENKVQKFLSQTNKKMNETFSYIKNFMINLKENVPEKEFAKNFTEYLTKIVDLAEKST
jgi:hypothetical protein